MRFVDALFTHHNNIPLMKRKLPWLRRELPYFVEAFEGSRYRLPNELWFMIDGEIKWREMMFDRKVEIIENNLNLDFDVTYWSDCTERIFTDPIMIDHICFFHPETDDQAGTLVIRGRAQLFSPERLFRLIEAYVSGRPSDIRRPFPL